MRQPRIKISAEDGESVYHCLSRTVNGEKLFGNTEKAVFRKQLWQIADFCGVQVLTYVIMSNHFHIVVRVPQTESVSDAELLRRYRVLYPKPSRNETAALAVIQQQLVQNGPKAVIWRTRMRALMSDISQYMKLLKQRFTRWFNRCHGRFGTLWAERFKSLFLQPTGHARLILSAYVDLNGVRAGLASDPVDYPFCGYAEAVGGGTRARLGLMQATGVNSWDEAQAAYRQCLFGIGADPRENRGRITQQQLAQVICEQGRLPLHVVLRCRVRSFSDGAILGSHDFVTSQLDAYRRFTGRRHAKAKPLPASLSMPELTVLRRCRGAAIEAK